MRYRGTKLEGSETFLAAAPLCGRLTTWVMDERTLHVGEKGKAAVTETLMKYVFVHPSIHPSGSDPLTVPSPSVPPSGALHCSAKGGKKAVAVVPTSIHYVPGMILAGGCK